MSTAQRLAVIELLRARPFPAEPGPSEVGASGPGYHLAELARSEGFWDDDGTRRVEDADQYGAEHTALTELLTGRYGEPHRLSLWSLQVRAGEGEEIPQPWRELSDGLRFLHLWRTGGRWIALGLTEDEGEQPFRLIAAVTETDPP
ncbi:hypothetical protein ACFYYH_16025 [Streptomyces sp. NPDC002018]|uniref:hypothetical protein n=1 Tax=Streptomyces sp. NPDC002018 TaxID=3364629 RepID=UPI0036BA38D4